MEKSTFGASHTDADGAFPQNTHVDREIPGVQANAWKSQGSAFSSNKHPSDGSNKAVPRVVIGIIAVVAVVVLVGNFALFARKSHEAADKPTSKSTASAPSPDAVQKAEKSAAKSKGWTTEDYIQSVPEKGRKIISSIPTYQNTGRTLGPANAKVKVHLFTDFSCPICAKFHSESMAKLEELAKSGKIQLVWHNFVIFEQHGSDKPARGTLAAAKQGKLFEFADAAYSDLATTEDHAKYTDASVRGVAQKIGLDMTRFDADYTSPEVAKEASAEQRLVQNLRLNGTPAVMIGNAYLPGVAPTKVIENTIDLQATQ